MGKEAQFRRAEVVSAIAQNVVWRFRGRRCESAQVRRTPSSRPCDLSRAAKLFRDDKTVTAFNSQETYEKSSSAIVGCGIRCRLFSSSPSLGLSLPWTVLSISLRRPLLPISLPRALLPVSVSRTLLPAPGLGCRCEWASRILSLLVSRLMPVARSPFCEIARVIRAERPRGFSTRSDPSAAIGLDLMNRLHHHARRIKGEI